MRHRAGFNRLGRKASHRKALHSSLITSLIQRERVRTTAAKAKEIRRSAEKMVTRARTDSVQNRRLVARRIGDESAVAKLFTEIAPRYVGRPGGYTRILRLGRRSGDGAEMVLLEFVGNEEQEESAAPRRRRKKRRAEEKSGEQAAEGGERTDQGVPEAEAGHE